MPLLLSRVCTSAASQYRYSAVCRCLKDAVLQLLSGLAPTVAAPEAVSSGTACLVDCSLLQECLANGVTVGVCGYASTPAGCPKPTLITSVPTTPQQGPSMVD